MTAKTASGIRTPLVVTALPSSPLGAGGHPFQAIERDQSGLSALLRLFALGALADHDGDVPHAVPLHGQRRTGHPTAERKDPDALRGEQTAPGSRHPKGNR